MQPSVLYQLCNISNAVLANSLPLFDRKGMVRWFKFFVPYTTLEEQRPDQECNALAAREESATLVFCVSHDCRFAIENFRKIRFLHRTLPRPEVQHRFNRFVHAHALPY